MSGRPPCALFPTPGAAGAALPAGPEVPPRLWLALLLSLALHALLVLAPSPRSGAPAAPPAARALDVRLVRPPPVAPVVLPRPKRADSGLALRPATGLERLPVPPVDYVTTDRLTKRPMPLSSPVFDLPKRTARFVNGTVALALWINDAGGVDAVEVEKTDLPPAYSYAAAEGFRKLRFEPGEIDGRRVAVLMRIEVTYRNSAWR